MKKLRNLVSILLLLTMLATSAAALGEGALSQACGIHCADHALGRHGRQLH